ncbi:MAG: hypothetical protein ACO3WN_05380 [Burkholderiaceae bacterium]
MGPETIDTIVEKSRWQLAWKERVAALRTEAPWRRQAAHSPSSLASSGV